MLKMLASSTWKHVKTNGEYKIIALTDQNTVMPADVLFDEKYVNVLVEKVQRGAGVLTPKPYVVRLVSNGVFYSEKLMAYSEPHFQMVNAMVQNARPYDNDEIWVLYRPTPNIENHFYIRPLRMFMDGRFQRIK